MATINVYEGLFILDSDLYARNPEDVSGQIDKFIAQCDGEVLVSRLWEERKLAYPIKGHKRGTYWLTYFRLDAAKVKEINRQFQISDGIIRFLFLKVDPRLVETLVEHAKAGPVRPTTEITDSAEAQGTDVYEDDDIDTDEIPSVTEI
ncbi:MAG: 30S ribosomal protein S6 [Thermoguttaceae bacterium]